MGKNFFLIKFSDGSNYDKVLHGGPWFIKEHFLAIKPWEPYIKASEASFSIVAVWVRFLELPIEFYDSSVIREIDSAIRPVLRIDSYTASGSRASYARLCLQTDLTKPLINMIRVGILRQNVMYKGISSMCFCYERIKHRQENCVQRIKPTEKDVMEEPFQGQEVKQTGTNLGEWMLVTRKKNPIKNERNRGTKLP